MRHSSFALFCAVAVLGAFGPGVAAAQAPSEGFRLDRHLAPPSNEDGLALQLPDTLGHLRWSGGLVLDYARGPLVLEETNTGDAGAIVEHRLVGHFVAALGLGERGEAHLRLPVLLTQSGDEPMLSGVRFDDPGSAGVGDGALGGSVRFYGQRDAGLQLGAAAELLLPLGSESTLAGDQGVGLRALLLGSYTVDILTVAVQLGTAYRPTRDYGTSEIGSEALYGVGLYAAATSDLTVLGELRGSSTLRASNDHTALEALFGGRYVVGPGVRLSAGLGAGLTEAIGVPDLRALLGVGYAPRRPQASPQPPPPPPDRDGDGIVDARDECPDEPSGDNPDPDRRGCPAGDRDGDGLVDPVDDCPDEPPGEHPDPDRRGCPADDRDGDGVVDPEDECPDEPSGDNPDPDRRGCPASDRDGDGVVDAEDDCPDEPGVEEHGGCPAPAQLEESQIRLRQRIRFDVSSADIRSESHVVLEEVRRIMDSHPEIGLVRIEGHTDSSGAAAYNRRLSQARAEAVRDWLIEQGIAPERLEAVGLGESRPVEDNATEQGRRRNRRVEFHWSGGDGSSEAD